LLRPDVVVFDAVYNPRRTRLLQEAAETGCRTIEGIEMFLGQAYVQFELWTGHKAPREVMRQVLEGV
ncbi:MAG: shikimate dehydrogenase, partial [Pirellulaceae bacterium]|nr:shikimate dehydrogenase [Pirellulaceae bacterium]